MDLVLKQKNFIQPYIYSYVKYLFFGNCCYDLHREIHKKINDTDFGLNDAKCKAKKSSLKIPKPH